MAAPLRPQIALFAPRTTHARIVGTRFADDGTHINTEYQLLLHPDSLVAQAVAGAGLQAVTVPSVSLAEGAVYVARLRYRNESGWGDWSRPHNARVPRDLDYTQINAPGSPASGGECPRNPDYILAVERKRDLLEQVMATHHVKRRPARSGETRSMRMRWVNLTTSEHDALRAFLLARMTADPPESFTTGSTQLGTSRTWLLEKGRLQTFYHGTGIYTLEGDAIEINA